jgi:trk system potassium uptake protein TrkH
MFIGACAGSTGGGMKVSRIIILFKTLRKELSFLIHKRSVKVLKFDGNKIEHETMRSINVFFISLMFIFTVSVILISLDNYDFTTSFTAVAATINNIGPGLEVVGPMGNYGGFSNLSKFVLMFTMLAGRLEVFPMILLFAPGTWKR